jgi:hypothetical protein
MDDLKKLWPDLGTLNKTSVVDLAPYGVLKEYSEAVFETYNKKIIGMVTAKYEEKKDGNRTDFVYSLYITKTQQEDVAQIKILELSVQDDGWYPAELFYYKPYRQSAGLAENEGQLRKLISNSIQTDFVKSQISALLK